MSAAHDSTFMERLQRIPGTVFNNVPAFFGFALADYIAAIAISMLPQVGGVVGMVESAAIYGMVKVVDHSTWTEFNRPHADMEVLVAQAKAKAGYGVKAQ